MGTAFNVNAEENLTGSNYVPSENSDSEVTDMSGSVLQSGDKVVIGDYTVEYQEEIVCLNPYARETTKNTGSCDLNVTKYFADCSYTINTNTVDNSSSTDPTYTIGLTMKLPSQYITIVDVVTVHADGTYNKTHYE